MSAVLRRIVWLSDQLRMQLDRSPVAADSLKSARLVRGGRRYFEPMRPTMVEKNSRPCNCTGTANGCAADGSGAVS